MLIVSPFCGVVGATVPFTRVARMLGFSPLPTVFFLVLVATMARRVSHFTRHGLAP
jgi:hypothetical protein